MNADGTGQRRLTHEGADDFTGVVARRTEASRSSGAAEGSALTTGRIGGLRGRYVMNADGSGQRLLVRIARAFWSPDGLQIAFGSYRDRDTEIYVVNADGSGRRNLTQTRADEGHTGWSPAQT